ncbi:MAG TPA: MBL fold metallo-hydrolase [Lachnospiraceae bacterium]|nr:MBL fold metallo-hydrolase [Lachnospiraceae bacterium]
MKLIKHTSLMLVTILVCVSLCSTLSACSKDRKRENNQDSISIKYIGNSCFYITFADGTKLVSDPYGAKYATSFGEFPEMEADVMTISHSQHDDHTNGVSSVKGDPQIINPEDVNKSIKVGDVTITGYTSSHVANMGGNTIFVYEENGLKIVHMGETDSIDSKEAQDAVRDADVILAYAGEYGKVKNKDSFKTLYDMNIKVLIPQHYSMGNADFYGEPKIDVIKTEVPEGIQVTDTDEFFVTKDMEKQFVALSKMGD